MPAKGFCKEVRAFSKRYRCFVVRYVVNSPVAAPNAVLTGLVCALMADFAAAKDIEEGRLVRLLPDYLPEEQPLCAVIAHRTYIPARVRVLVDFLLDYFSQTASSPAPNLRTSGRLQ
ncbi:LysR substrate-binding domain-containing protein [Pseudomonadota bacterium]